MKSSQRMLKVYRHDAHKLVGQPHDDAPTAIETASGPVDTFEPVPYDADADASAMSRPAGEPKAVTDHATYYRRSAVTGDLQYDPEARGIRHFAEEIDDLLHTADADTMHSKWLFPERTPWLSIYNETPHQPYTSLRYHTLLVAALFDLRQHSHDVGDVALCVTEGVIPHRTIYAGDGWTLSLLADTERDGQPFSPIAGTRRNWARVYGRLRDHPFDHPPTLADAAALDSSRFDMMLDAQLRRFIAWSTALQFIEDFQDWRTDHD